jgi:hypothetical protein
VFEKKLDETVAESANAVVENNRIRFGYGQKKPLGKLI